MQKPSVLATFAVTLLSSVAFAQAPVDLDVTRIALFTSGVGYFECDAKVDGEAAAELSFRTAQINDILKSLIVRDLDGGNISVVSYASRDPIEKTLKSFGVDITGKPTLAQLLDQLRGEPVEIAGPRTLKGVIVGVEKQKRQVGEQVIELDMLNLLTETGLEQLPVAELRGIKLANQKVADELMKALATLSASHDADKKSVLIRFSGQGNRRVRAAYLLETPLWKTSYRLALSDEGKPLLQGWAIVENATEEDWKDVKLSLVSGRPISFVMDLYSPLYVPRPQVELEIYASLRPPEYEAGYARKESKAAGEGREASGRARVPMAAAPPPKLPEGIAADVDMDGTYDDIMGESVQSVATAEEAGELFQYSINMPVSIARQRSAMLPIVNEEVAGEKLSVYNRGTHAKHPLNALFLENTTKLHLMQGPVTLFDGGVYAGDAKLPDLKPGEKRLVGYALDLGVEVDVESPHHPEELVSLRINQGVLWLKHKHRHESNYTINNKGDKPRTVVLEHPGYEGWKLIEPPEPYEKTANMLRFKVEAPAKTTAKQKVLLENLQDQTVALIDADFDFLQLYIRSKVISPRVKEALERIVALRGELNTLARERGELEKRVNEAVAEQGRIRENLKTLDRSTDAYNRQLKKFDDLETQIDTAQKELAAKRAAEEAKRVELQAFLQNLDVE